MKNIDWGAVVFAVLALGLLWLVASAIKRMRNKGKSSSSGDDADDKKKKATKRSGSGAASSAEARREARIREQKARHAARARAKAAARGELDEDLDDDELAALAEAAGEDLGDDEPREEPKAKAERKDSTSRSKSRSKTKTKTKAKAKAEAEDEDEGEDEREGGETKGIDVEEEQRRLTDGLTKTRGGFIARLGKLFKGKQLDEELLDEIEEVLFTADIGVPTAQSMIDMLRKELSKKQLQNPEKVWTKLREHSTEILEAQRRDAIDFSGKSPFVLLVVGVNGSGKTTTIGKLAARLKADGRSLLLAAGDTFRAAAVQQLEVWAERADVPVVKGKEGADPASVIVNALKQAKHDKVDVVIADTAGRLQTKKSLMEELEKIHRAIRKQVDGAPHETLLVVDATTGQNAISQAKLFSEAVEVSGVVLTKLDGTAKGGVVLGISHELALPVRFVGIGEGVDDLRDFEPTAFVGALFADSEDAERASA